jgi:hypothetical protein
MHGAYFCTCWPTVNQLGAKFIDSPKPCQHNFAKIYFRQIRRDYAAILFAASPAARQVARCANGKRDFCLLSLPLAKRLGSSNGILYGLALRLIALVEVSFDLRRYADARRHLCFASAGFAASP